MEKKMLSLLKKQRRRWHFCNTKMPKSKAQTHPRPRRPNFLLFVVGPTACRRHLSPTDAPTRRHHFFSHQPPSTDTTKPPAVEHEPRACSIFHVHQHGRPRAATRQAARDPRADQKLTMRLPPASVVPHSPNIA